MKLSIIIPVFNSSDILEKLVQNIKYELEIKLFNEFEIIFVNDCSSDDSWLTILQLSKKYSFIKGIDLKYNIGQHSAIFVGLIFAKGLRLITMDDDLQHPPSYIVKIYNELNNFDICYTSYIERKHLYWKIFVSNLNNFFSSLLFNKSYKIYLSSFRGFTSSVKNQIINGKPKKIFLDSLILKYSKKITSIEIIHQKRFKGDSNYNIKKLFTLWFDMIENFHLYPIRFGSLIGIFAFLFVKFFRFFKDRKNFQYFISNKTF